MSISTKDGIMVPGESVDGIIGIQGVQGSDEHYYCSTSCTGISHTVETDNTTNIYNYLCCTGCTGTTGQTGGVVKPPTETYLNAGFDYNQTGYQLTVTSEGLMVPFQTTVYNNIQPIIDYSGSQVQFLLRDSGIYEICYHVYLKEAAQVGARIRRDAEIIYSSILEPDSVVAHLSAVSLLRCFANNQISMELYTNEDLVITLKGIIGASITIKKLSEM